ncbi:MAG: hypothetical protein ACK48B_20015, partial [Dolichospermum sp.]
MRQLNFDEIDSIVQIFLSDSGCPGFKDLQDESRDFITNYPLPITHYPMLVSSSQLYEQFIQQVIGLSQKKDFSLTALISKYVSMNYQLKLEQIDKLKVWLDDFRPFDTTIIAELKKLYDVRFTYNSNAIEGNTLTQSET